MRVTPLVPLVAAALAASSAAVVGTGSGFAYDGPGVVVADAGGSTDAPTFADNGAVVCEDPDGDGVHERGKGGVCIPFSEHMGSGVPAVKVTDDMVGGDVAYQVCVDNDGDGLCGTRTGEARKIVGEVTGDPVECVDDIRFSHADDGANHNPLSVPDGFQDGCASNGGFAGWIVMVCAGAHDSSVQGAHSHPATNGTVQVQDLSGGTPQGDYCGGPVAQKAFVTE